jgi:hypothetical protein
VVHGETLVRSACERDPQCMTAAGFRFGHGVKNFTAILFEDCDPRVEGPGAYRARPKRTRFGPAGLRPRAEGQSMSRPRPRRLMIR